MRVEGTSPTVRLCEYLSIWLSVSLLLLSGESMPPTQSNLQELPENAMVRALCGLIIACTDVDVMWHDSCNASHHMVYTIYDASLFYSGG